MRLEGQTAVVTGSARGIGRAIAERLLVEGASVIVADRDREGAERTAADLGERARPHRVDITRRTEVEELVRATVEREGKLDVLVNNAAHARYDFALDLAEEDWDYTIGITLTGTFVCAQAAARVMAERGSGKIVNVSSISADVGLARTIAYGSAKGGVNAMTRILAVELAEYGIQVNAVAPGPVLTEFSREVVTEEGFELRRTRIPLGRWGEPEDIAAAVAFLASPDADWMTGEVVTLDGGYTILGAMERRS